jgi:hypothetical protein
VLPDFPDDLLAYLSKQTSPTLTAAGYGEVELIPAADLHVETLTVTPNVAPFAHSHPHAEEFGHYPVPAVNLIRPHPKHGFPAWLFLWLPNERRYGSFDLDHGDLIVFAPSVTWSDIAANPEPFVSTSDGVPDERVPLEYLEPWHQYSYVVEEYPFKEEE